MPLLPHWLVLGTHLHTFTSSTVHEGQLRTPTLFMPHLHAPSLWFKKLPEELLNSKTFGNGLSITQSSAFRSWKNPNKRSQTLEHYTLHHKTSTPFKDFPWLDSLLNCFIHRLQKERLKKPNTKTTNIHSPKTKRKTPSEQPEVWATYWGFLLSTNSLIKSKQTKPITIKALEPQRFPCLWSRMLLHLIHILLLSHKKYSSVSEQFCLSAKVTQNQCAPEKALKLLYSMAVEHPRAFLNHSLSWPKKASL